MAKKKCCPAHDSNLKPPGIWARALIRSVGLMRLKDSDPC